MFLPIEQPGQGSWRLPRCRARAWERQRQEGESLVAFIRRSPLAGADDLDLDRVFRDLDLTRDLDL